MHAVILNAETDTVHMHTGGAIALCAGLMMMDKPLAGILSLSTWLPRFVTPSDTGKATPVLMCHGDADNVVLYRYVMVFVCMYVCVGVVIDHRVLTCRGADVSWC